MSSVVRQSPSKQRRAAPTFFAGKQARRNHAGHEPGLPGGSLAQALISVRSSSSSAGRPVLLGRAFATMVGKVVNLRRLHQRAPQLASGRRGLGKAEFSTNSATLGLLPAKVKAAGRKARACPITGEGGGIVRMIPFRARGGAHVCVGFLITLGLMGFSGEFNSV